MQRILIAYYSLGGHTERVATDLAARLGADLLQLRELTERRGLRGYLGAALDSLRERAAMLGYLGKSAGDYDLTIVGTPIWVGKITPAARTYLKTIRGEVGRIAFFTTSGATDVSRVIPTMQRLAGRDALAFAGFTEPELRDAARYGRKLNAFVTALRAAAAPVAVPQQHVLTHAHA